MLSITPSKLGDYITCPEKFKLRHIEKLSAFTSSAPVAFGQAMHAALQQFHNSENSSSSMSAPQILERHWDNGAYASSEENESYFSKGCRALQNYSEATAGSHIQTLGTEKFLSFIVKTPALQIRLSCKADRISLLADGTLEVVDYKTGAAGRIPTREFLLADLPTFIYYLLARASYPKHERVQVTYLNVMSLAQTSIRYTAEQVAENKRALWQVIKAINAREFDPHPSEACAWCDVQDGCKVAGRALDFASI